MADGKITIAIDVDGKPIQVTNKQLDAMEKSGKKASSGIKDIVTGMGLLKVASGAINIMKQSLDAAISRFDTMQRFPKVLSSLGFNADQSSDSINRLSEGIDGLPTKLDDVVSTTQRMTAMTGNLNKSTDATLALNNAFLASGASASDAQRGTEQYIQMLSKGEVDLQSWRTLQESMSVGLQQVAQQMGFTGEAATTELYGALKSGDVTFRDFQENLISLGTGTGELAALAKVNSEGIATSFSNLRNAVGKGLAKVLENFDKLSKKLTGKSIAQNLDGMKVAVNAAFEMMANSVQLAEPVFRAFIETLKFTKQNADVLIPVITGLAAAYATLKIIKTVSAWSAENAEMLLRSIESGRNLILVTKAQMAAKTAEMGVQKAGMALTAANNGLIKASTLLYGVMTGAISIGTAAQIAMTAATTALSVALKVLTGPIGWVVAGVGALAAAGTALWKWLNKETDASKKLNKEQDKLAESTNNLTDAAKHNAENRKDNLSNIGSTSTAYQKMADELVNLAGIEKKSAGEKALLKSNVESLNKSVDGLNIAYDEETGRLNMSTEQMKARIATFQQQETVNESQQQLTDILKEQAEVEAKLSENAELREQWNQKLEEGAVKSGEYKDAIADLDEQEKSLTDTQSSLQTEYEKTKEVQVAAADAVAQATEDGVYRQVISYENLSETQKAAVDSMKEVWQGYVDQATNMFDVLSDKQEMSVGEMQENLEENQRIMSQWADNISSLASRGIDEGLLAKLRDMGPEGAGYVAALASASDEELSKLSTTFANGATTATNSFKTAFNADNSGIDENVMAMVMQTKGSLTGAIESADFGSLGKNVAEGVTNGITEGSADAGAASQEMGQQINDRFRDELDINSPSGVFEENGGYLVDGLVLGIENGKSKIQTAMDSLAKIIDDCKTKVLQKAKDMSTQFPEAFSSLNSQMNSVGSYAMQGLADGINAGAGSALSAAQSVANRVTATIKKALDVHSPSRVMRDEVGKFIPQGIALGIEADADSVYSAMKTLSGGLMDAISPEVALQTDRMGLSGAVNQITNNNFYNKNDDLISAIEKISNRPIVVEQNIDGKPFAKVVAQPITEEQAKRQKLIDKINGRG